MRHLQDGDGDGEGGDVVHLLGFGTLLTTRSVNWTTDWLWARKLSKQQDSNLDSFKMIKKTV